MRRVLDAGVVPATEEDWGTEYLSADISAAVVDVAATTAVEHIRRYGTGHTEAIVTRVVRRRPGEFVARVDAAAVMVNASTRFTDGGEFGFGAEIGISTQKLHARGPMGLPELTSTKYVVTGDGHIRPDRADRVARAPCRADHGRIGGGWISACLICALLGDDCP